MESTNTYRIPTYHIQDELDRLVIVSNEYPSSRMVRTKKGKRAIAALIDLEKNHNHSWYEEISLRARRYPGKTALFYRGTEISYRDMLIKADNLAKYLADKGIVAGDEIPVCMTNTPELVYLMLAANKLGAKLNVFGEQFDHDYLREILSTCTDKIFFSDDSRYDKIKDVLKESDIKTKVISSLADSLPLDPKKTKGYEPELEGYYKYPNKAYSYKMDDDTVETYQRAMELGSYSKTEVKPSGDLETDFLITYTSGSTVFGKPKPLIHKNRSLIVSGRFHDCELSGNPDMKDLRCLAHIPPESNTDLIACISDNLMQGWSVGLEPEYDHKKCLDYVFINKPNYLNMTTSFFIEFAKQYLYEKRFKGRKLDFIFTAFAVGEKLSPGEEKLINKCFRVGRAGSAVSVNGFKFPFVPIGIAAGDCEHGAIYYTLWKQFMELRTRLHGVKSCGAFPEAYVSTTVLKPDGKGSYKECKYGEYGLIVANSYSSMSGYKNNPQATKDLIIKDNLGRTWLSCNVYGYIDKLGGVHMKGREELLMSVNTENNIPLFKIEDVILEDTKKVLSCQVIEHGDKINAIVQFQHKVNELEAINSLRHRVANKLSPTVAVNMDVIVIPFDKSYPMTHSGKRKLTFDETLEKDKKISNEQKLVLENK